MRWSFLCLALVGLAACTGSGDQAPPIDKAAIDKAPVADNGDERPAAVEVEAKALEMFSSAFVDGAAIPVEYTADGEDMSPPLGWSHLPEGTVEVAVIVDDPDAPGDEPFVHWLVWGLPTQISRLSENTPKAARSGRDGRIRQGMNDFGTIGWKGPAPPPGKAHRYRFTMYALSEQLSVRAHSKRPVLEAAMEGKILAQAQITGTYSR